MRLKRRAKLAIGAVCVLVSVVLAVGLLVIRPEKQEMLSVVVLCRDVDAGELLSLDDVVLVELPRAYVESLEGTFSSVESCLQGDSRAVRDMVSGQVVMASLLMGNDEPMHNFVHQGKRLVSVCADSTATAVSGQLKAGDIVSVASVDPDTGGYNVDQLMRYLQVYSLADSEGNVVDSLGTLSDVEKVEEHGAVRVFTLICTEEQAVLLAEIQQRNPHLIFVGRGPMAESLLEGEIP